MVAGEEFIINFTEDLAFISDTKSLAISHLNLPAFARKFYAEAHWLCRIISYNAREKKIFAEIVEYHLGHEPFLPDQEEIEDDYEVEKIIFKSIDTNKLLITLGGVTRMEAYISNPQPQDEAYQMFTFEALRETEPLIETVAGPLPYEKILPTPKIKIINSEIKVAWKDFRFDFGFCTVEHKMKQLNNQVELRMYNQCLRPEFDAIKNYFSKKLNSKKINVKLQLKCDQANVIESRATSKEIDLINPSIIESIKFEMLKELPKKKYMEPIDKSLFTMDQYFESLKDESSGLGAFYDNESMLLDDILSITSTKHYKNLRYLSDLHAHQIMKLRFILKPFSFVFLIEGVRAYHIIWETLNTEEATYVWHTEKNLPHLKGMLQHVEAIIQTIQVQGKLSYIQSGESNYKRIFHDYSKLVDGFVKWKGDLENILY